MRTKFLFGVTASLLILAIAPGAAARKRHQPDTHLFKDPVRVSADDSQTAAEPSIRAARDGNLYIVAPTGLGGARTQEGGSGGDLIWRSTDRGKTWTYLGSYDQAAGGGDADIAVDRSGVLWGSGLTIANTTAAISTNEGDMWCVNPVGSLDSVVDRQWIETYKSEPFAFMTTGDTKDSSIILDRLERTPGDCPVVSNTITVSGDDEYQWPGELAVDEKNDLVYVSYNTCGIGACSDGPQLKDKIMVARTDLTLGDPQLFTAATTHGDSFDSFTSMDVDQAGNVYVVWNERRPRGTNGRRGFTNSYLAVSKDRGKTWGDPIKLNQFTRTTAFPWIVAGSKGRVAVTYYGIRRLGKSPETVARPERPIPKWKVWVSYSTDALRSDPRFHEVRATGTIHEGNICTSGTGCASGTRDLLDFFQIDLDPCGHMVITYTDNSNDEVDKQGNRVVNNPERVMFLGQKSGPKFYATPLNDKIC
ncbi:MAG TPA: sialidase family protein [Actinomycetota bacterium]|nr:sialidase family protein [Actinomycetota bacterium]